MRFSPTRTLLCALLFSLTLAACGTTATPTTAPAPASAAASASGAASASSSASAASAASPTRAAASPAVGTPSGGGATPGTPAAGAAAPKLPVTVTDVAGKSVTVADVSRIVPLTGDVAEIIYALGLGKNIVAADTSAVYPEALRAVPKIGYNRTLAAEPILAAKPTLVIGGEVSGPPAVLDQLRGAGVPVVLTTSGSALDVPAAKIRAVGAALGLAGAAEQLAAQTQREIDDARALAARGKTKPRVMFLNVRGAQVQQIAGKDTPANTLIEAAGGVDAGAAAGVTGYKPITAEALVAGQPEIYLLFSGGLASVNGVDGLLQIPGVAQTPAGQNKRVLDYEDQYLLGFGPRTGQVLRELTLALHPELK